MTACLLGTSRKAPELGPRPSRPDFVRGPRHPRGTGVRADVPRCQDDCQLLCKNLQAVPNQASTIGLDRPSGGTADPVFPGSAVMCCHCLLPVTPEAAGSSPVDPANLREVSHLHRLDDRWNLRHDGRRSNFPTSDPSQSRTKSNCVSFLAVGFRGRTGGFRVASLPPTCHPGCLDADVARRVV
jgi:hypothetical protein